MARQSLRELLASHKIVTNGYWPSQKVSKKLDKPDFWSFLKPAALGQLLAVTIYGVTNGYNCDRHNAVLGSISRNVKSNQIKQQNSVIYMSRFYHTFIWQIFLQTPVTFMWQALSQNSLIFISRLYHTFQSPKICNIITQTWVWFFNLWNFTGWKTLLELSMKPMKHKNILCSV
jgi:hypothetical protein